jgi:hypothetical protein
MMRSTEIVDYKTGEAYLIETWILPASQLGLVIKRNQLAMLRFAELAHESKIKQVNEKLN